MSPLLHIRGLSIALPSNADRQFAVENLDLSIDPGEVVCVVGESGSGKSVTAHAVMGLLPKPLKVAAGNVMLEGIDIPVRDPAAMRAIRGTGIGMIFQEPMTSLNPVMKIDRQIKEMFWAHGKSAEDRAVIGLLEEMGLPDPAKIARSYPHQLSGGQRQRAMIAMAVALGPKLLIADEPTTALDVTTQAQILKLIARLQREHGTAVMFITHDFGVVREIADKVVVLQSGVAVEQGPADDVLDAPRHSYSRDLIAAVPSLTPPPARDLGDAPVVLEVKGLSKGYGTRSLFKADRVVKAVDDVSIHIRRGEVLGIVGESGSGKSTTARSIIRLIEPDSGSVNVGGVDFLALSGKRLRSERARIQMVFQDPFASLNPRHRVGRIIADALRVQGVPQGEALREAIDLLKLVGLPEQAADRFPHEFSGGQRQRIGLARAVAMKPDVLVADEAVSALDVSIQARVLRLLADLQDQLGLAILFVTHDLRVAAQICDRIGVMHKGKMVELRKTSELFQNPEHQYTKQLLASVPGEKQRSDDGEPQEKRARNER